MPGSDGVRLVPDAPPVPPSDSGWLRARVAELEAVNARLRQAAADRDELAAAQLAVRDARIGALAAQVEELRRKLGKDSLLTEQRPLFPQLGELVAVLVCTVAAHDRRAKAGPGGAGCAQGGRAGEDGEPL